jgi:hypothetical protein
MRKKSQWLPCILVFSLFLITQPVTTANHLKLENIFDYVSSPSINLIDEDVTFKCVFSPSVNPDNVTLYVLYPNMNNSEFEMVEQDTGKFVNETSFSLIGRYYFFISAFVENKQVVSRSRSFWISASLKDKDNDKMDDAWEQFYGFDSSDPTDAYEDFDGDGYKNLDEFTLSTDPLDADYVEFVLRYIDSHLHLIIVTMFFLLTALFCSLFGLRRSTRWI